MSMQVINHRRLKGQGLLSLPSPPYLLRIVSSRFRSKLTRLQSGFQDSKQYLFFDSCSEIDFSGFLAPHEGSPLGKRRVFILYKFQSTTYNNFRSNLEWKWTSKWPATFCICLTHLFSTPLLRTEAFSKKDYAGYDVETIPVNLTNKYRWQCKPMLLLSLCKIFSCMTLRPHM